MASSSATVASRYPEITLSACEGYTETLVDWVNTGQLDFALINVPRRKTPLAAHHVMDEEMCLPAGRRTRSSRRRSCVSTTSQVSTLCCRPSGTACG